MFATRAILEKGKPLHPFRGVSRRATVVASAARALAASYAVRQNAHSYGGIPGKGIQSMRVQRPGADRFAESFRATRYESRAFQRMT